MNQKYDESTLPTDSLAVKVPNIKVAKLKKAWQAFAKVITLDILWEYLETDRLRSLEPRIRKSCSRHGDIFWSVYDPVTGKAKSLGSEQDVMIWLDQRYYR